MAGGSSGLLRALSWGLLPSRPGSLRDHVRDAVDDGVCNAQLLVNELVGSFVVPGRASQGKKTKKNQQNKKRSESPGFALWQPLSLDSGQRQAKGGQPELLSRRPPPLTSAAAWRAGTPGSAAGTALAAAAAPSPAPGPGLGPAPGPGPRRSLRGHRRPPSAAPPPLCARRRRPAWPPTRAPLPARPPTPPRAALTCTVVPLSAAGAGAALPGAMGVLGLAGVVRGRDGTGRRRAVPGALQRRRQDPLPAQHRGLPPSGLRPRVVPQPGEGPAGRPRQPRGGGEPAPG